MRTEISTELKDIAPASKYKNSLQSPIINGDHVIFLWTQLYQIILTARHKTKTNAEVFIHITQNNPANIKTTPKKATTLTETIPLGMGRSTRCFLSKLASKVSFKNIPPKYRNVAPKLSKINLPISTVSDNSPSDKIYAAKQLDQTVGRFEILPKIKIALNL